MHKIGKRAVWLTVLVFVFVFSCRMTVSATETQNVGTVSENAVSEENAQNGSVSDNSVPNSSVSDNSVPQPQPETPPVNPPANPPEVQTVPAEQKLEEVKTEVKEEPVKEKKVIDPLQFQTLNYKEETLTDWSQVIPALQSLTAEKLTGSAGEPLVLQLQNVCNIPAEVKDALLPGAGGSAKVLQCSMGNGATIVLNGAQDNSGFCGISNTKSTVNSEKRGKKSMAVTVRFESHQNFGALAGLQINLPQCEEGTKVSVYAETITTDAQGNVSVGENVCIGTTKADGSGNVEVPIQATANYMFVYKAAKE